MIAPELIDVICQAKLPCFVYDASAAKQRAAVAASLLDRYFFPVKVCPEEDLVRAVLEVGCGLDLCSTGDVELASAVACPGKDWKFTSACADDSLLRQLRQRGARLDADSVEQALRWGDCGATACGLRIMARNPKALYGAKFGIPVQNLAASARRLAEAGMCLEGLHLHDQHANLSPSEFVIRVVENFAAVERGFLRRCRYVNIGGSWPMRHGVPAPEGDLRSALMAIRERLAALGFEGAFFGEPGRWLVESCGYWAARVVAVKPHPQGRDHCAVVLDTNTPVPCRPSQAPFVVLRDGELLKAPRRLACDLFGSANTALDTIGVDVRLPALAVGDVVVALGQGAYTRAMIPPFNERERPAAVVWRRQTGSEE